MIDAALKNPADCTGCSACASICPQGCISMDGDAEGFLYPAVDIGRCVQCSLCAEVCPALHSVSVETRPAAYACINKNENIRMESSSGGVFSLLSRHVLESPGGGIVFGAGFDERFRVAHSGAWNEEAVKIFRGSKYVQSSIGDTYKQAKQCLERGMAVLFTGTPCQIGGLKAYLGKEYDRLLCADLICHGVPSPRLWEKYVAYRERCAGARANQISFRAKNEGWKQFSLSFSFENDTVYRENFRTDPYLRAFQNNICLRPSCYACRFRTLHRQSDITLADFWGLRYVFPDLDDDKGVSLLLINSEKGEAAFGAIGDDIVTRRAKISQAVLFNPSAVKNTPYHSRRNAFFAAMDQIDFDELVKSFCTDSPTQKAAKKILSSVGTLSFAGKLYVRLLTLFKE